MTAKEFNELTAQQVTRHLSHLGFKRSGVHFYIYQPPNLMVLHKKTSRGKLEGFYLALTHDFLADVRDENGDVKVPSGLESYPFSIPVNRLQEQYANYGRAADFTYDTNFITREVLPTRKFTRSNTSNLSAESNDYIRSSINTVLTDGMRLLNEFSPAISYLAVTRHKKAVDETLHRFKAALEQYLLQNGMEIPVRKTSWVKRLFGQ